MCFRILAEAELRFSSECKIKMTPFSTLSWNPRGTSDDRTSSNSRTQSAEMNLQQHYLALLRDDVTRPHGSMDVPAESLLRQGGSLSVERFVNLQTNTLFFLKLVCSDEYVPNYFLLIYLGIKILSLKIFFF